MPISSVVISCRPEKTSAVAVGLKSFPQLEIHHQLASNCLIAVMETATVDEEVSLVKEIMEADDVLDVRLAYHNFEDLQDLPT